jgi:PAS domain S-box-containing protein
LPTFRLRNKTYSSRTDENREDIPGIDMASYDKKIIVTNRLLAEMEHLGHRLDELQGKMSDNARIMRAIMAENERYRCILEAIPQRFYLKDEQLRYVLCSSMFASDLNRKADEIIGKSEEDLVPVELAKMRRQQEMRIIQSGQIEEAEEILTINGQHRAFITIKVPTNGNGTVSGIFGLSVDISMYWRKVVELKTINRQMENLLVGQSQQIVNLQRNLENVLSEMRRREEEFRSLSVDHEKNLSLKDVELAQLRNELKRQPAERDEMLRIQRKFHELQKIIDGVMRHIGSKYSICNAKEPSHC